MKFLDEYYLAYGSNVSMLEMKMRCPNAKFVGLTKLPNNTLICKGNNWGYLTTQEENGCSIDVAIYKVTQYDKERLDVYEGYPNLYHIKYVTIEHNGVKHKAFYYEMNRTIQAPYKGDIPLEELEGIVEPTYEIVIPYEIPAQSYIDRCYIGYKEVGIDVKQLVDACQTTMDKMFEDAENYAKEFLVEC